MKIFGFCVMILLSSACALTRRTCENPSAPEPTPGPLMLQARQADLDGKYDEALELTNKVLKFRGDSDEALAWAIRGSTYYLMGNDKKALTCWKRALAIDPCMKEIPEMIKNLESRPEAAVAAPK